MTQKEEFKKLAEEIVEAINQTTNDYDAREQVVKILKKYEKEVENILWTSKILTRRKD